MFVMRLLRLPTVRKLLISCVMVSALVLPLVVTVSRADHAAAASPTATYTATETIPVPPASTYAGSGGGDGWAVAMTPTAVYNVFHHDSILQVACHLQTDASPCWNPETITDTSGNNFATSGQPGLWVDQASGRLYVFATRVSDQTGGVVCVDTMQAAANPDPFCGFTALSATGESPVSGIGGLSDPVVVGSNWYAFNYASGSGALTGTQNHMLCFSLTAAAACPNQPYAFTVGVGNVSVGNFPEPAVAAIGNKVIVPVNVGGLDELSCFDSTTLGGCAGSWPARLNFNYPSSYGAPFPLLSGSGAVDGLCLSTGSDPCFDLTGATVSTPANMTSVIPPTSGWNGPAVVLGPRAYVPNGNSDEVDCYDYSTSASCTNFPKQMSNLGLLYTVNPDPARPTCIWVNADDGGGQIQNFDAYTGAGCGQGPIRVLASSMVVNSPLCAPSTYSSLQVLTPAPGTYNNGTVDFEDSDGHPIGGLNSAPLDATGTVNLTGMNLLTSNGLPQFLITLNGTQGTTSSVEVKLTWTSTSDPSCVPAGSSAAVASTKWSGYTAIGPSVAQPVHARVIIPHVTCNAVGAVSLWVGYDGVPGASNTVEQDGVNVLCFSVGAKPTYDLWYELYKPNTPKNERFSVATNIAHQLQPGDAVDMFVSIIKPDKLLGVKLDVDRVFFSLAVHKPDGTKIGQTWQQTVKENPFFGAQYGSSECIAETPLTTQGIPTALPQFDQVTFQNCSAIDSSNPLEKDYIARNGHTLDTTDDYTRNAAGENQFVIHWLASQ